MTHSLAGLLQAKSTGPLVQSGALSSQFLPIILANTDGIESLDGAHCLLCRCTMAKLPKIDDAKPSSLPCRRMLRLPNHSSHLYQMASTQNHRQAHGLNLSIDQTHKQQLPTPDYPPLRI